MIFFSFFVQKHWVDPRFWQFAEPWPSKVNCSLRSYLHTELVIFTFNQTNTNTGFRYMYIKYIFSSSLDFVEITNCHSYCQLTDSLNKYNLHNIYLEWCCLKLYDYNFGILLFWSMKTLDFPQKPGFISKRKYPSSTLLKIIYTIKFNKAKAISAKLLDLNLKN